jgi:hypothetical protein
MTLPFMDECSMLGDMEEEQRIALVGGLDRNAMDVDRWEIVISCQEYLNRFKDSLATVQLVNRVPSRQLVRTYHIGPAFNKWMLLGHSNHMLWVPQLHKEAFFGFLGDFQTAQPGQLPLQASTGQALMSTSVFIYCPLRSGCRTLRLKVYGQKMPLDDSFMVTEPAQEDDEWAKHNEWDLGTTFLDDKIRVFRAAEDRVHGIQHYPMVIPASLDHGTVNITAQYERRNFSVKIYPRMVHVLKSFNSHLQGGIPRTIHGMRRQVKAALTMIHNLSSKDDKWLGGFRIEVTVKAPTLKVAKRSVDQTSLQDLNYWLGIGDGPHAPELLKARFTTKRGLLENANWIYHQADQLGKFAGDDNGRPSGLQVRALTDFMNGLGWNAGLRKSCKSMNPNAWWYEEDHERNRIYQSSANNFHGNEEIGRLFNFARNAADHVPCKDFADNPTHRYRVNNRSPYRIRCCMPGCFSRLARTNVVKWIATLVEQVVIDGESLAAEMRS